jgi:Predicted periplasmic lipoprotein (DUF2279)
MFDRLHLLPSSGRARRAACATLAMSALVAGCFGRFAFANPAQTLVAPPAVRAIATATPAGDRLPNQESTDAAATSSRPVLTDDQVRLRTWAILGGGAAAIAVYGMNNWWQDGFTGDFRTVNEGWFGQNTNDGGADKLGHMFATYVGTRLIARSLEWAGNDAPKALSLAAWSTLAAFTAVEVADAFTTKWRFSKEDAIMNAVGVGLAVVTERNPELDRLFDFRLLYQPSDEPRRNQFDPFGDYSGQTYLLVAKASGAETLRHHPVLRYFELAVGYGTRGYGADPDVPNDPSRNVYVGISINLSELLGRTAFAGSTERSRTQRAIDGFLEVVQIPGTVALTHRRL